MLLIPLWKLYGMNGMFNRKYLDNNVLEKARERISFVFDNFKEIVVSISSGKDSTALYWLAVEQAEKRNKKIKVFFLDQEAEYSSSIDLVQKMMSNDCVTPYWFQIPLRLTNATSYEDSVFTAWEDGGAWIRDKDTLSIHSIDEKYPDRFYSFFNWFEKKHKDTAFLVGIRTEESLNRLRAVIQFPGYKDILWSTKTKGHNTYRFYPIYDWSVGDIWKYIKDYNLPYNSVYDKMFRANKAFHKTMRVSNLIHEKSFKALSDLQTYEPDTFNKLSKRIKGIHVASIYAKEDTVFEAKKLPDDFKSWRSYRDYLMKSSPLKNVDSFKKRFSNQPDDEESCRRHVKQILINDYENNLKVNRKDNKESKKNKLYEEWWDKI